MLLRRTWLMALPTVAFVVVASAQGCGTEDPSTFPNLVNDEGGVIGDQDGAIGPIGDGSWNQDAGWDGTACATTRNEVQRLPVYMQMVLDGSGSMDGFNGPPTNDYVKDSREKDTLNPNRPSWTQDGSSQVSCPPFLGDKNAEQFCGATGKKWLAAREALKTFWESLAKQSNTTFGVGFLLFSSTNPGGAPNYQGVDVAMNIVDNAQVAKLEARVNPRLNGSTQVYPYDVTPLVASISGQGAILATFNPANPPTKLAAGGTRVLVVITDGVPSPTGGNSQAAENTAVIKAVGDLRPKGITTFVIGVGSPTAPPGDYDPKVLGQMAVAGGVDPAAAGCNPNWTGETTSKPCHFQITPGTKSAAQLAAEFTAAMNAIRNSVVKCDFPILKSGPDAGEIDPSRVNVVYEPGNGGAPTQLPNDPANGWMYDAYNADAGQLPTKVTLYGSSCNTLKTDLAGRINIVLGCKTGDPVIHIH